MMTSIWEKYTSPYIFIFMYPIVKKSVLMYIYNEKKKKSRKKKIKEKEKNMQVIYIKKKKSKSHKKIPKKINVF